MKYYSHIDRCSKVDIDFRYLTSDSNNKLKQYLEEKSVELKILNKGSIGTPDWIRDRFAPVQKAETGDSFSQTIDWYGHYGNIVAVPVGVNQDIVLFVGTESPLPLPLKEWLLSSTNVVNIHYVSTSWLCVGHLDEVVSLAPKSDPKSNQLTFFVADPIAGYDMLKSTESLHFDSTDDSAVILRKAGSESQDQGINRISSLKESSISAFHEVEVIREVIRWSLPTHQINWVRIPVIFGDYKFLKTDWFKAARRCHSRRQMFSLLPNAVNNLVVNQDVFFPVHSDLKLDFRRLIEINNRKSKAYLELKKEWMFLEVASHNYNKLRGHLHCVSRQHYSQPVS